jgi:xanthine dehydrogenase YagS FAD-binding subunit
MKRFEYIRPETVEAAVAGMAEHQDAKYLGGGTNLVDLMKLGVETPEILIDVTHLPLDQVEEAPDGSLRIGAMVRNSDLAAHGTVRRRYPMLSEALLAGASGQLRNMATVGGNLLQRTRCRYFQDVSMPCNKRDPGSGCPAIEGEHHNLAILGASKACVATHPSDMVVALLALDAGVEFVGIDGSGTIPLDAFYRLPGDRPEQDTSLPPGALITVVTLPSAAGRRSTYRKARERASYAFALVSVAAALEVRGGTVQEVRLALGGVAHRPWRARRAEEILVGLPATEDSFRRAIEDEMTAARPLRDNGYKVPLAGNLVVSVLRGLTAGRVEAA